MVSVHHTMDLFHVAVASATVAVYAPPTTITTTCTNAAAAPLAAAVAAVGCAFRPKNVTTTSSATLLM